MIRDLAAARRWFDSYVRLVSERDLGELHRDLRPPLVLRLLRMLAARHGQMVQSGVVATDFGLPVPKIRTFLELLEGTSCGSVWTPTRRTSGSDSRDPPGLDRGRRAAAQPLGDPDPTRSPGPSRGGASWEGWVLEQLSAQVSLLEAAPGLLLAHPCRGGGGHRPSSQETPHPREVKRGTRVGPYELRGLHSFLEAFRDRAPFGVVLYAVRTLPASPSRLSWFPSRRSVTSESRSRASRPTPHPPFHVSGFLQVSPQSFVRRDGVRGHRTRSPRPVSPSAHS